MNFTRERNRASGWYQNKPRDSIDRPTDRQANYQGF